jgi:tetratricopeptide (TPR) repeat protein
MQTFDPEGNPQPEGWAGLAVRCLIGLVLIVCLIQVARETGAVWLAGGNSFDSIRRSERWDPRNPDYRSQLGRALAAQGQSADPTEIARSFEDAVRLGPRRAENWAALGGALEFVGNISRANSAYEHALELFPRSPAINWQFANFLIRASDATRAVGPLQLAITGDPSLRMGAFDLAWRAGIPRDEILAIVPARQETLSAYLDYLNATGRLDAAADAWKRMLASPEAVDLDAPLRYFDALLNAHRVDELTAMWAALARHEPERIHWQPGDANRITNGGFEGPALNGGFGWRIVEIDGAETSFDTAIAHGGSRSLVVHFAGTHNLDFGHVAQYVAVAPEARYRLIAYTRTEGITTDSGPRVALYDAFDPASLYVATEGLTGTTSWQERRLEFTTGPKTRILAVQVVRPQSRKLDNQIAGTLWLDDFSLTAIP